MKKELYEKYLAKLDEATNNDRFDDIDLILEEIYTEESIPAEDLNEMYDVLTEATLYAEMREKEYKDEFIRLIGMFK